MEPKKKILLVDDVKLFLRLEETFFKRTGCDIITAESGRQAIDIAKNHQPDLILLDFIMPDIMGDEVIRQLKSNDMTRTIPVMVVSTSSDQKDIDKCFAAGAEDYVTKPINAQEVLAKAANMLNIPQRVHTRVPVRIQVEGEAEGKVFTGYTRNVSKGGLLVEHQDSIPEGQRVTMGLPIMEGGSQLHLHGQVVRDEMDQAQQMHLIGIQFFNITATQTSALSDFILACKKKEA